MNVLISINPRFLGGILKGEKRVEIRKTQPAKPDENVMYYCYETGGKKAVTAVFSSSSCRKVVFENGVPDEGEEIDKIAKDACMSVQELKKYLGKGNTLYLIGVDEAQAI
nr:hypothetical protein [Clostridia bacterium]